MSNQKVTQLRQRHPRFVYEKVEWQYENDELMATFFYTTEPDLHFQTTLTFPQLSVQRFQELSPEIIENWLFHTGMVEALSYWKATCSPHFVIRAGYLNEEQLQFWQDLIHKGLSEFFFINQIDGWQKDFVQFVVEGQEKKSEALDTATHTNRTLVPIGGGKDSIVTAEVLKRADIPFSTFTIQGSHPVMKVAEYMHQGNILMLRNLDPQLKELNAQGYLNGHTPFSAMVAFTTTLVAYLYDFTYVALSNEWSANEGNTVFLGQKINHQYSKTVEFEEKFRAYAAQYLSTTIQYFSFLRPLHEIQIAQLFAQYTEYYPLFLSCNRGHKTGKWCGECAKCLFVYIMMSPFIAADRLQEIFGKNLFTDESLKPILDELTGQVEVKSFDCVGTRDESIAALYLTIQNWKEEKLPVLLEYVKNSILPHENDAQKLVEKLRYSFVEQHFLPEQFEKILREAMTT